MANSIVKFYTTVAAKLSQLAVKNGQIIFVSDTRKIYLDFAGQRVCYDAIAIFDTDQERLDWLAPVEGFYYVRETHVIWNFSGSWTQITPENLTPISFGVTAQDFPAVGNNKILYIADDATYKWDAAKSEYKPVSNLTQWVEME